MEEYLADERATRRAKLQKTVPVASESQSTSINEAARAKNIDNRALRTALATLPRDKAAEMWPAISKHQHQPLTSGPEESARSHKTTLYELLEEDLMKDKEMQKSKKSKDREVEAKLRWMLEYVVREPSLSMVVKAKLCVLMGELSVDWKKIEFKLNKAFGDD